MIVTQITVTCHEKRNHPYEYGHKDSSVTLTATIDHERLNSEIAELQWIANKWVNEELNSWVEDIRNEKELADLRQRIYDNIYYMESYGHGLKLPCSMIKEIVHTIKQMPFSEQGDLKRILKKTLVKRKKIEEDFEKYKDGLPF